MWGELLGCLEDQAALAHAEGRVDLAVSLAAAAAKSRERLGLVERSPRGEARWQAHLDALRRALPDVQFGIAWQEAQEWQIDNAIRNALSLQDETATA
jgi:hypothetical protein